MQKKEKNKELKQECCVRGVESMNIQKLEM
jgi:hypothetical protein